jgi:hypothetical protein
MNCWHCQAKLIWQSDSDCEEGEPWLITTHLSCPGCKSIVEVHLPDLEHEDHKE